MEPEAEPWTLVCSKAPQAWGPPTPVTAPSQEPCVVAHTKSKAHRQLEDPGGDRGENLGGSCSPYPKGSSKSMVKGWEISWGIDSSCPLLLHKGSVIDTYGLCTRLRMSCALVCCFYWSHAGATGKAAELDPGCGEVSQVP